MIVVAAFFVARGIEMEFWDKFKRDYRRIKDGKPGRRFRDFRTFKSQSPDSPVQRVLMISFALLLVVIGLAIGWLPGPGGFLSIIGLAILAPYVPGVSYCLDKSEILIRRSWKYVVSRFISSRS